MNIDLSWKTLLGGLAVASLFSDEYIEFDTGGDTNEQNGKK